VVRRRERETRRCELIEGSLPEDGIRGGKQVAKLRELAPSTCS